MNPPPPPPHGEAPKDSGLPPGKYDIFIIPPHSAGSGFLYLPSLRPSPNSFAAGFATALLLVAVGSSIAPLVQTWWQSVRLGGMGMFMFTLAIGVGAWALGKSQTDGGPGPGGGGGGAPPGASQPNTHTAGAQSGGGSGAAPGGPSQPHGYAAGAGPGPGMNSGTPGGEKPKPTWQRTYAGAGTSSANTTGSAWEKAREETRKKEEERKAKEAERKRKEELERKLKEAREREAREREAREKAEREAREKRERDIEREREKERERQREREAEKEREEKEKEKEAKPKGSSYAFSAVGEKTNPWPRGTPTAQGTHLRPSSPTKNPPPPTVNTYLGTDDAYSYRPYDKPRKPTQKKSASSIHSESSYAASHTTSQTTPPPSHRAPYSTKDPDKIVIKAVYTFTNAFPKRPTSQLVSGVGSVTDGLILRITTEGLFIDDDVRGVPQREWDVKAWTLKLVEVWCPTFRQGPAGNSTSASASASARPANPVRRLWSLEKDKAAMNDEADALLVELLQVCKDTCRLSPTSPSGFDGGGTGSPYKSSNRYRATQTGVLKSAGLHVLRASIRDQEGKRYVFVITEEESWKVAVGLQRLRRGTQVRALGVSGMSTGDARTSLESLGWG